MKTVLDEINEAFDEAIQNAESRSLGTILKVRRSTANLKIEDISKSSGLSKEFLERLEKDEVNDLLISEAKNLTRAYKVSISLFISSFGSNE